MNLPNKEKKNLADLSDKELAQLSPEELEEAKKAKANLLAIKKTDKEVGNMAKQEEWNEAVQQYAQEHNFSLEEAAEHLKKEMGAGKLGTGYFLGIRRSKVCNFTSHPFPPPLLTL